MNMTPENMPVKMMLVGMFSLVALASPPHGDLDMTSHRHPGPVTHHASRQVKRRSLMAPAAVVDLVPGSNQISGRLEIHRSYNGLVFVGTVYGLTPGKHGFHVHEKGDLGDGCKAAGGHFNPFKKNHGAPEDLERHAGDFGNVVADYQGVASIYVSDNHVSLDPSSQSYIGGLAIVVHAGVDDLGRGGNPESLKTGNAGARSGCGIIQVVQAPAYQPRPPQHSHQRFPHQTPYG
ncbi:superoxide dismutase [Cu-Zn] isoform X2 [Procambarus clarkii]